MNLFFGKISQKFDIEQLKDGYYSAPQGSSWFGDLQIGDYVFMIGGDKIQFWKAREWGIKNGKQSLLFDILSSNLGINVSQLIALKFLKITKALAVLTSRSARNRAFFKIEYLKEIQVSDLLSPQYYKNEQLYRVIRIVEAKNVIENSEDVQLIFEDGKLKFVPNNFIEDSIKSDFVDNLDKKGKGAKMKDNVLEYFSNAVKTLPTNITYRKIGFRRFYDTFFCDYKEKSLEEFQETRYWLYAPGENANKWDEFYSEGIMGLGWDELGDLSLYESKNAITQKLQEIYKTEKSKKNDTIANFDFKHIINIDDIIIAKKGRNEYIGYGYVTSESYFDSSRNSYKNIRKVDWQKKGNWNEENGDIVLKTLTDITKYPNYVKKLINLIGIGSETELKEEKQMENKSLNQILFGPPGTGKTYNTINKAISIANPSFDLNEERNTIKDEFDKLSNEGRIAFTTFHQNMSYEDFIEGIKPIKPEEEDSFIKYDIQAGIFKIACANAAYLCYKKYKQSIGKRSIYSFDELHDAFIDHIQTLMDQGKPPIYKTLKGKDVTVIKITSTNSIKARALNSKATRNPAPLTKENLQKLYDKFSSIDEIRSLKQVQDAVEVTPRITEFYALFKALKEFEKNVFKPDTDYEDEIGEVEIIDIQDKIKKFNAGVYLEAIKKYGMEADPVVLIIDEINRGNVSQIFGELITLIEDDKRLGKEESLEVYLPYSKSKFGVPPNLYIIGTMNTADRSVEALDTALRRRFSFEEMPPLPSLLSPNHRFWELLWKYKEIKWDDPKYSLKEKELLDFMGASQKIWDEKENIWNDFEKEGKSSIQTTRFSNDEFMGVNLEKLLTKINSRIEKLLNKDHRIGHSYFINITNYDDLKMTFHNKIIPLLQEYFFGDYGKIGLILGKDFFETVNEEMDNTNIFCDFYDYDGSNFESQTQFRLKNISKLSDDDFKVAIATLIK